MRSPDEVAREWCNATPETEDGEAAVQSLAALIRQERDDAFAEGFLATVRYADSTVKSTDDHWDRRDAFEAARLAAVEGRKEGEGDAV